MAFQVIIEISKDGYNVEHLKEITEIIAQGKKIGELNSNLPDALKLLLDNHFKQTLILSENF